MLTKKDLGKAIALAIELKVASGKVKSKAEIARHFGVKPPSIADWENKGSISKEKLSILFEYFSDVVPLDHWADKSKGESAKNIEAIIQYSTQIQPRAIESNARSIKDKENISEFYSELNERIVRAFLESKIDCEKIKANTELPSEFTSQNGRKYIPDLVCEVDGARIFIEVKSAAHSKPEMLQLLESKFPRLICVTENDIEELPKKVRDAAARAKREQDKPPFRLSWDPDGILDLEALMFSLGKFYKSSDKSEQKLIDQYVEHLQKEIKKLVEPNYTPVDNVKLAAETKDFAKKPSEGIEHAKKPVSSKDSD